MNREDTHHHVRETDEAFVKEHKEIVRLLERVKTT